MVGTPARSGQLLLTTGFTACFPAPSARPGFECWSKRAPRSAEGSGHIRLCRRDHPTTPTRSGKGSVKISHPQVLAIAHPEIRSDQTFSSRHESASAAKRTLLGIERTFAKRDPLRLMEVGNRERL